MPRDFVGNALGGLVDFLGYESHFGDRSSLLDFLLGVRALSLVKARASR